MQKQVQSEIRKKLLVWYARHQRDLPWRRTSDPYRIWISEIMLQQTRVTTVIPYYRRFIRQFPNINALARASLDEVLKAWENLGYYSRPRYLHAAAKKVMTDFNGHMPESYMELRSLPGIGPYTAGAVLSIAFKQSIPAIDGNTQRVVSRIFEIRRPLQDRMVRQKIHKIVKELMPMDRPGFFNQALMDLGAVICVPKNPDCGKCPLSHFCKAFQSQNEDKIPIKVKRATIPHQDFTAGIIRKNNRILLMKRPTRGLLAGLWKLPGGECLKRGSLEKSLKKKVRDELGLSVRVGAELTTLEHTLTHFRFTLHVFQCSHLKGNPKARSGMEWTWADAECLADFAFSKADREIMKFILRNALHKTPRCVAGRNALNNN